METGALNNMSVDKSKKIDIEVKKIHTEIKKSSLVLRERMRDIQQEMTEWDFLGGIDEGKSNDNGYMH